MHGVARQKLPACKLQPPTLTPEQVPRAALCDLLCNSGTAKLVLLRAPAGFGKTTVMAQTRARLEASGIETAWLNLDPQDNDTLRLLAGLAMTTANILSDDVTSAGPLGTLEMLASHPRPFVLFLDEFEAIQDPDVLNLLRSVVERLPRGGQIIVGSRSLPGLGQGRLRARGQLLEIDAEQLSFSLEETTELMRLRHVEALRAEDILRLHQKTEGWATALWLASIALAHGLPGPDFIERFSGTDQALADYLTEDVLARQSEETRQFLLRTSILRQLDASICDALNPGQNSSELLERLAAANLFLSPVSGEAHTYRYHRLFADYLRFQLEREQPADFTRLHLAASGWYESQGRPVPAIDHAIDGNDYPYAVTLLSQHAIEFLKQGRIRMLARWFSAIPERLLDAHPLLQVASSWATCFTRGPREAMELLKRSGCMQSTDESVVANVTALNTLLLSSTDRHDEAFAVARDGMTRLPSASPFADVVLINNMSHLAATLGDNDRALELIAKSRSLLPDSAFNRTCTEGNEGILDLQQGRLRQATARFRTASNSQLSDHDAPARGNAWACVLLADAMYEAQQFKHCEQLLSVFLPMARDLGLPERMISCQLMLTRIAFQRGDVDKALEELIKLEHYGQSRQLPRLVATARLERSRLFLLQGNKMASRLELTRANDEAVWPWVRRHRQVVHDFDYYELAEIRWELTFGDAAAALPRLRTEWEDAMTRDLGRRALKLDVLRALAFAKIGDIGAATRLMTVLLGMTCQEGFVRLVLDEGQAAARLVHLIHAEVTTGDRPRPDPIFVDYLQRLLELAGPLDMDTHIDRAPRLPGLIEPFTRKEERTLQLLAEGYSNSAMAEKLFVSDSTVRTHLRNINMKLNAQNRTQAVAIARRLKLIR